MTNKKSEQRHPDRSEGSHCSYKKGGKTGRSFAAIGMTWGVVIVALTLLAFAFKWYLTEKITIKQSSFAQLPGWQTAELKPSLDAFRLSCKTFLKQDPEKLAGSQHITLQIKDWQPACRIAMKLDPTSNIAIKGFFQTWFTPVEFYQGKPMHGLFTGYFLPLLHGSLTKTKKYNVPLYAVPSNLVTADLSLFKPEIKNRRIIGRVVENRLVPFYNREEINKGAIDKTASVLLWIDSPMDRVFLEIEGSGVVELENGKQVYIGYAGENGATYTSIASIFISQGILTRDMASSQRIKQYLEDHPKEIDHVLNQNKSFVFFHTLKTNTALGAQGVGLTPGYALAVDPDWVPYGTPTWLNTTIPSNEDNNTPFNRLMIAQDTGGAIRGTVRGDVFWGAGKKASFIASHMHDQGRYWLLLPKHIAEEFK